jgi:hypothetical protein
MTIEYDPSLQIGAIQSFEPGVPVPELGFDLANNTKFNQSAGMINFSSNGLIDDTQYFFTISGNSSNIPADPTQPFSTVLDSGSGRIDDCYINTVCEIYTLTPTSLIVEDYLGQIVPEPPTWAMFLIGFGGIGWMLRTRRKKNQAALPN